MIAMFISTALLLLRTLESIATPDSVKANGMAPPKYRFEGITDCDTTNSISLAVNSNIKSSGNLFIFLRTACFSDLVSTWYISARWTSKITFSPLNNVILRIIFSSGISDLILLITVLIYTLNQTSSLTSSPSFASTLSNSIRKLSIIKSWRSGVFLPM